MHAPVAARVSKPTPTPSIAASIKKQYGSTTSTPRCVVDVDTNAQLFNAAYVCLCSVMGDPMAHSPRPGGMNFMSNIREYISCVQAQCAASTPQYTVKHINLVSQVVRDNARGGDVH